MTKFERDLQSLIDDWGRSKQADFIEKYQPKPLPIIPKFVADEIEQEKSTSNYIANLFKMIDTSVDFNAWLTWNDDEVLIRAWLDGYTIDEEKKFLLKHIDMSKADEDRDYYLSKWGGELTHYSRNKGEKQFFKDFQFTQSEIDELNIGSYEKIEVKDDKI